MKAAVIASLAFPLLAMLGALATSCHVANPVQAPSGRTSAPEPKPPSSQQQSSALPSASAPAALDAPVVSPGPPVDAPAFVALGQRIRTFGGALSNAIADKSKNQPLENFGISPPSIYAALSLLARGAQGETRSEIEAVLGSQGSDAPADLGVHSLFETLRREAKPDDLILQTSSATWVDAPLHLSPTFSAEADRLEHAETRNVAFASPQAVRDINAWASNKTHGLIQELYAPGALDPTTRLVLTNAIYFKALWETPFPRRETSDRPFNLLNGGTKLVPTMRREGMFAYSRTDAATIVEIPYRVAGFSMFLVVPQPGTLLELERQTNTPNYWPEIASTLNKRHITLLLPRFRVEAAVGLGSALHTLGIRRAFSERAQLGGFLAEDEPLKVDSVQHGVVVDVTEEHTEAAAVTGVGLVLIRAPNAVAVDRPFLFAIVHRPTWTVLFSGRVVDPKV